jgi:hypothetical protein
LLWQTLRSHFPALVADAQEQGAAPLPRFIHLAVEDFLRCGILSHGFLRAHCEGCQHSFLVPFSCKERGICPSCDGRRMNACVMHLDEHVLPAVPVRQWVLSAPFELRPLLARFPDALTALNRLFVEEIRRCSRNTTLAPEGSEVATGAVVFVQRFGGSLNLHVHLHVLVPDGVFVRRPGEPITFLAGKTPDALQLQLVVERVARRMLAWLGRHGYLRVEEREEGEPQQALQACLQFAAATGSFARLDAPEEEPIEPFAHRAKSPLSAQAQGFSLHAGVRIGAADREGLRRLVRYCARPAICAERLSLLPDGRIAYQLKKPNARGATHRVMSPQELVARVIALIPPPYHHLVRYHGVLAPHHAWRAEIVATCPAPAPVVASCGAAPRATPSAAEPPTQQAAETKEPRHEPAREPVRWRGWVDWATLLAKTFGLDVLCCPRCGQRMRLLGVVRQPELIRWWLHQLGVPPDEPP